jgi:GH15 family glucan-1,4-alpha-glucosidase
VTSRVVERQTPMTIDAKSPGPLPIDDYALIGDGRTAALVGRNGSIDWLCWPNFNSDACFAALLGSADHGRWLIAPSDPQIRVRRQYRGNTMILETLFDATQGSVVVIDFMPIGLDSLSIVRRIEGRRGQVAMDMQLTLRFEYGSVAPWVTRLTDETGIEALAGPNRVVLRSAVPVHGEEKTTVARFTVTEGEVIEFALSWNRSHLPLPPAFDTARALSKTEAFWSDWSERCIYKGPWREPVLRSLLTLKSLTFFPTGAIVAAPTTSLPESLGGARNWDYRFCWLRDAALTLVALMAGGYIEEASAWRHWLYRSVAGDPEDLQIMYGLGGERRLYEWSLPWLPGYQGSSPVRIGNQASEQLQLDTYGELMLALSIGRRHGLIDKRQGWALQTQFIDHLEKIWDQPDEGIWEVRGGRRQFTHSKVMAWLALDCTVRDVETFEMGGPIERWRKLRDHMHSVICDKGFNTARNSFTQSFGSTELDASLLLIPLVGFLPPSDSRVVGTVKAIEKDLLEDGFVLRYRTESGTDGLPPGEGVFLPCSFWLADVYQLQGRDEEALALFKRLLALCNDVGLLSEEYDPQTKRLLGNFPQAFSHLEVVRTALALQGLNLVELRYSQPAASI